MTIVEKYWDDAREGDECVSPSYTVTKERILAYADLTGDHTLCTSMKRMRTRATLAALLRMDCLVFRLPMA